nr:MAG TPA: hypothetical protein [Caudoviricetes sp.]
MAVCKNNTFCVVLQCGYLPHDQLILFRVCKLYGAHVLIKHFHQAAKGRGAGRFYEFALRICFCGVCRRVRRGRQRLSLHFCRCLLFFQLISHGAEGGKLFHALPVSGSAFKLVDVVIDLVDVHTCHPPPLCVAQNVRRAFVSVSLCAGGVLHHVLDVRDHAITAIRAGVASAHIVTATVGVAVAPVVTVSSVAVEGSTHVSFPLACSAVLAALTVILNAVNVQNDVHDLADHLNIARGSVLFFGQLHELVAHLILQVIQFIQHDLSPFLCYPLNDQIAVCNADCLRTGVFNRYGDAAAARHLDKRSHEHIKIIVSYRRGDNGCGTGQRLTADSQCHGNGSHSAAGRNGDIAAKAYLKARFALIGQTPQGHEAAALTVHDAGRGFHRGLGQGKVFTRCHTDGVRVAKFGHFIGSFHRKTPGLLPRRFCLQNQLRG